MKTETPLGPNFSKTTRMIKFLKKYHCFNSLNFLSSIKTGPIHFLKSFKILNTRMSLISRLESLQIQFFNRFKIRRHEVPPPVLRKSRADLPYKSKFYEIMNSRRKLTDEQSMTQKSELKIFSFRISEKLFKHVKNEYVYIKNLKFYQDNIDFHQCCACHKIKTIQT